MLKNIFKASASVQKYFLCFGKCSNPLGKCSKYFYAPASVQKCFLSSGKCSKICLKLRQVFKNNFYAPASAQIRPASAQKYFLSSGKCLKIFLKHRQVFKKCFGKCSNPLGKCSKIFFMLRQVLKSARQVLENICKAPASVQK